MTSEDRGTVLLMLAFIVVLLIFFGLLVNLAGKRWRDTGRLNGLSCSACSNERAPAEERGAIR